MRLTGLKASAAETSGGGQLAEASQKLSHLQTHERGDEHICRIFLRSREVVVRQCELRGESVVRRDTEEMNGLTTNLNLNKLKLFGHCAILM